MEVEFLHGVVALAAGAAISGTTGTFTGAVSGTTNIY